MKIGEVAKAAKVHIETIHYYEKSGFISKPLRTDFGYRNFFAEVVEDFQFIKRVQGLGFRLEEINKLLSVSREPEFHPEEMYHFAVNKRCNTTECQEKAKSYSVQTVPAVAVNEKLVDCCKNTGIDMESLKKAGVGSSTT